MRGEGFGHRYFLDSQKIPRPRLDNILRYAPDGFASPAFKSLTEAKKYNL